MGGLSKDQYSYFPVQVGATNLSIIGISSASMKIMKLYGITAEATMPRKRRHQLSVLSSESPINGAEVKDVIAFTDAANAVLFVGAPGPQLFLEALGLEVL